MLFTLPEHANWKDAQENLLTEHILSGPLSMAKLSFYWVALH